MKIHGTAKGGALSKKDFGVAFGGGAAGATCSDDMSDTSLWTKTSSDIIINGVAHPDHLFWNQLSDEADNYAHRTICGETISNTTWYCNFDQKMLTGSAANQATFPLEQCAGSTIMNKTASDTDTIGVYFDGGADPGKKLCYKDGTGLVTTAGNGSGERMKVPMGTLIYYQISRQTSTETKLSAFTDSDRTAEFVSSPAGFSSPTTFTVPSTVQGIDTWQSASYGDGTYGAGINLTLTNLALFDGVIP